MNARQRLLVACAVALPAAAALAQSSHLRPGLWEETVTAKNDNPQANAAMEQMKQRMAQMSPEQRAAMDKAMAGHGMGMGGAPNSHRVCITKEQIDRGFKPEDRGRCSRSNVSTAGNVTTFDFACQSERGGNVTGHGTYTEMGDSAFAANTVADMASPKMTMHIQSDIAGKFVSSDCGDIKPVPMAK